MKRGFTLPEILVAVIIVAILVTIAVPQYEKAVEKSRKAEVVATLKKLHESKMRMLETAEMSAYADGTFGMENLDFSMSCPNGSQKAGGHVVQCKTRDFVYWLRPKGTLTTQKVRNAVCAARSGGDHQNTQFFYYGEDESDADKRLVCKNNKTGDCELYGMTSDSTAPNCRM